MAGKRFSMVVGLALCGVPCAARPQAQQEPAVIRSQSALRPVLLLEGSVQKELGLSLDQIDQAEKLVRSFQKEVERRLGESGFKPESLQGLPPGERFERLREATGRASKIAGSVEQEYITKMDMILEPVQARRLEEIQIQSMGTAALQLDSVAGRLELRPEQRAAVREAEQKFAISMSEAIASTKSGDSTQYAVLSRQARASRETQVLRTLTPEQKSKFEEIKGKPFDLTSLRQFVERKKPNPG
ncbi:MAG: hypothetical protein ACKO0V_18125 [bacterium]